MKTGNSAGRKKSSPARVARLEQILRDEIRRDGPIPFKAFMEKALYYPDLGYYMAPEPRIGSDGDFYTSPHLHPVFGWLLAVQIDELRKLMPDREAFTIVEIGAGRGHMAAGIIDFIDRKLGWNDPWQYVIVERNPFAIEDQKRALGALIDRIVWKSSLEEVDRFSGCVIANEVLDAFPVHVVQRTDRYREIYVTDREDGLCEVLGELSDPALPAYVEQYRLPDIPGYRTEINLEMHRFLRRLAHILSTGFVISIDYGHSAREYYSESRPLGTLTCYARHQVRDNPYIDIGRQDITAHVNFTALRDFGDGLGMGAMGYCPQGTFLASLGIDDLIAPAPDTDPGESEERLKIKSLLFDTGESHQVMIQYKGEKNCPPLRGFQMTNRLSRL